MARWNPCVLASILSLVAASGAGAEMIVKGVSSRGTDSST